MGALVVDEVDEKGVARCESSFCYPAEIAHGMTESLLKTKADFWFLPQFKAMPSYERRRARLPVPDNAGPAVLPAHRVQAERPAHPAPGARLHARLRCGPRADGRGRRADGICREEAERAYRVAVAKQIACYKEGREIGARVLEEAKSAKRPVIVLCGRP